MGMSDTDISNALVERLQGHSTTISFDSVWSKYEKGSRRRPGIKKAATVPMIALITLLMVFTVGFASYGFIRLVDNTDYPFTDDRRVIGKWQSVDFVSEMEQFDPDERIYMDEFYLTELVFIKEGKMLCSYEGKNLTYTDVVWTKGMVLDKQEKTASKYDIKDIDGKTYMFLEWKSGDYVFRGLKPEYYVLKKVDEDDYSNFDIQCDIQCEEDKTDYTFSNDPQMLGSWKSVDLVNNIDDFKPGIKDWQCDLYLTELIISENGELDAISIEGSAPEGLLTWTKGLIINKRDKTASKCEIREMDGATYMFFEWKNGDYMYRGMKPNYYVLKKVE